MKSSSDAVVSRSPFALTRLQPDGTPDPTLGSGVGTALREHSAGLSEGWVSWLVDRGVRSDGRIIVGGYTYWTSAPEFRTPRIARSRNEEVSTWRRRRASMPSRPRC